MAKVKVKICGITNWTDAQRAIEAGAALLGFNFYAKSPRYIAPAKARRIVRRLPRHVLAVGVFVNETEPRMLAIARSVGLDRLQLHGDEPPASVARLTRMLPVIKAVQAGGSFRPGELVKFKRACAILLDGFDRRRRGGTGKTFDWRVARRAKQYARIFLAGGLTPENVGDAIRAAEPYAVDVCSGVEAKLGKKDPERIEALMRAVEAAENSKVRR
ncbi:MAG TPA: phosphoribosylanthranilate isomerase [Candidatus Acidoferrales bacterium]|nr:phosphoribosylanthranilate isomerase [Candidatus Acidoferrales bacterium]